MIELYIVSDFDASCLLYLHIAWSCWPVFDSSGVVYGNFSFGDGDVNQQLGVNQSSHVENGFIAGKLVHF